MTYGYLRVSTDDQDVNNQKVGVDQLAERQGLKIDEYIKDEGVSGAKAYQKRKLGLIMKKLKAGDVLIASEISRLGRDLLMVMEILKHCMDVGAKVYTVKDNYVLGDDIQSKVLAFAFGLSAEIERKMISQRTKEALARKRAEGVILGRPKGAKTAKEKLKLAKKEEFIRQALEVGVSNRKIAKLLRVDRETVNRYIKTFINNKI